MIKIVSVQLWVGDETKEERVQRVEALLDQAGDADLVILPEIWNAGYFCFDAYEKEAEPLDGPTFSRGYDFGDGILAPGVTENNPFNPGGNNCH